MIVGVGLAVVGFTGRYLARHGKTIAENLTKTTGVISEGLSVRTYLSMYWLVECIFIFQSKYYKGGFGKYRE